VFLIDSREDLTPTPPVTDPYVVKYGADVQLRTLGEDSSYRVVKVMYEPDELEALIEADGWHAEIDGTRWFIYGWARPR
jgi:hypothetical protein